MSRIVRHIPVLLHEVTAYVPVGAQCIVDGTLGHGGHTQLLCERFGSSVQFIGFDVDAVVLEKAQAYLADYKNIEYVRASYAQIPTVLAERKQQSDFILLDLGINWEHILDPAR